MNYKLCILGVGPSLVEIDTGFSKSNIQFRISSAAKTGSIRKIQLPHCAGLVVYATRFAAVSCKESWFIICQRPVTPVPEQMLRLR